MGSYAAQLYILDNSTNLAGVALTEAVPAMDLRYRGLVTDGLAMKAKQRGVGSRPSKFRLAEP
ncbi:MAG: hypothetical protein H6893_09415 [Brucellaceae bacterium]|nr:hypothetical protein [Brucellaceae bacterium]